LGIRKKRRRRPGRSGGEFTAFKENMNTETSSSKESEKKRCVCGREIGRETIRTLIHGRLARHIRGKEAGEK